MKFPSALYRRLHWLNLPTAVLMALLQRLPVARVAVATEELVIASPAATLLKTVAASVAALGAIHSLAGATQLLVSSGTSTSIVLTAGTSAVVAYSVSGTQNNTQSWTVAGSIPPGINFSGLTAPGTVNTSTLLLSGTPTTTGTYVLRFTSWQLVNGGGSGSNHAYTIVVLPAAATAPAIVNQPQSQLVALGDTATFVVDVSGNPAPTLQWKKGTSLITGATSATLILTNVQPSDAGTYTAVATNSAGTATSSGAVLTVSATSAPAITSQPQGHTLATGSSVVFGVEASGGNLTYQWNRNGAPIAGATASQYLLSNAQPADAASYTATVTNVTGAVTSNAAVLSVGASADPGRLINASVRIVSGLVNDTLFMGFVTGGAGTSGSKQLLIRGIGPTLTGYGVLGAMVDPILEIYPQGQTVPSVSNDNWAGDAAVLALSNAVGAFALPSGTSKDAALVTTLAGGVYSAKVFGVNSTTGTVLAEVYDANPAVYSPTTPRLINLSARVPMANDNPLIAGFVIGGSTAKTVMIRAIGPFLAQFFGTAAMADPQLEVFRSGSAVANYTNDNWGGSALITSTGASVGAFALPDPASKDAVLLLTLDPGVYSAKVTGVNNASGITLVEIYEIP